MDEQEEPSLEQEHHIHPMSLRNIFVSNVMSTPQLRCPHCGFSGRGWQNFPKPSLCGKIWGIILCICCCCCLPFCCDCSIEWNWMCPACHHLHKESQFDPEALLSTTQSIQSN